MDANGTHFQLMLGRDDWAGCTTIEPTCNQPAPPTLALSWAAQPGLSRCAPPLDLNHSNLEWDAARYQVTLQSRLFQFESSSDSPLSLSRRRGAGHDRYGNWYWIGDSDQEIRVNSAGTGKSSHFWATDDGVVCEKAPRFGEFAPLNPPLPPSPQSLSGLAVTHDHYLVAGTLQPAGLVIFDLHAGGAPRQLLWPADVPFEPFDMAPRPGGGVWILDRVNARYWALDRHFDVLRLDQTDEDVKPDLFQALDDGSTRQSATRSFPEPITLNTSSPVAAQDPIAIEAGPDGTVLILDNTPGEPFSLVFHYRRDKPLGQPVSTDAVLGIVEDDPLNPFHLRGYDFCFVPDSGNVNSELLGKLYVAAVDGYQSYLFNLCQRNEQLDLQPLPEYLPMRLFGGKGLVTALGPISIDPGCVTAPLTPQQQPNPYYDLYDSWVPLVPQSRPRFEPEATLYTPIFDGDEPDCVWHRLMLDGAIPVNTAVQVWSRAANEKSQVCGAEWLPEPDWYLRGNGSELPWVQENRTDRSGTFEFLFQRARGRYLQLKLTLTGHGRASPRLRALRAYYPRFSYRDHYLPGVYREDAASASFLDRFLANPEGILTGVEDKIATAEILFDVRSTPSEALDWLASWFGIALDPAWDETRRRLFIKHATDFFQYRGTIHGLLLALHLAFDPCVDDALFDPPGDTSSIARVPQKYPGCTLETATKLLPRGRVQLETIRIIEKYRTRGAPSVVLGDPTQIGGPRQIPLAAVWDPSQGGGELSRRYDLYLAFSQLLQSGQIPLTNLQRRYQAALAGDNQALAPVPTDPFPIRDPGGQNSTVWQQFAQDILGFVPSAGNLDAASWRAFLQYRYGDIVALDTAYGLTGNQAFTTFDDVPMPDGLPPYAAVQQDWTDFLQFEQVADLERWQNFLARRYRTIQDLNQAYSLSGNNALSAFSDAQLPSQLPADVGPLTDWYQFEGLVLAMRRTAHQFSVLLPTPALNANDAAERQRRLDLATRVVDLEKPAHTVFDVRFYWAMFRIGEARLGQDTLLDVGSRAPQLAPPLVLGQGYLLESYLAPGHPQDVKDRQVLGRDPLAN